MQLKANMKRKTDEWEKYEIGIKSKTKMKRSSKGRMIRYADIIKKMYDNYTC